MDKNNGNDFGKIGKKCKYFLLLNLEQITNTKSVQTLDNFVSKMAV